MTNEVLFLVGWISFLLIGLMAVGVVLVLISAVIMYGFPKSKLAEWLDGVWFDKEETTNEIWNHKAGECISGKKWNGR